jgi:peptide/nickel transport system substrate-binding protein
VNADAPFSGPALPASCAGADPSSSVTTSGVLDMLTLNTRRPPFDDVNVRRAVVAGFDRAAELCAFGGRDDRVLATHFLPPGVPGFAEAGGHRGPGSPMCRRSRGDLGLAPRYLRRAGFAEGRCTGSRRPVLVRRLGRRGLRVRVRAVSGDRANELCGSAAAAADLCLQGW